MHDWCRIRPLLVVLVSLSLLLAVSAQAQWAVEPGATVRDVFGPPSGFSANMCRGACGGGCPTSCERTTAFECDGDSALYRLVRYECGTHAACRIHDDCLDACVQDNAKAGTRDCELQCDAAVVESFGAVAAAAWLSGQGPYDGRIVFEYSREEPDARLATYECPQGTTRQCSGAVGCLDRKGQLYEPMFAGYQNMPVNAMQVSSLRTGLVCSDHVCTYAIDIPVTGADLCGDEQCTRFGVEFDYRNADPAMPLECATATVGGEGDFVNTLLKQGADAITSRSGNNASTETKSDGKEDGLNELVGLFGKILASGESADDINVSITPLDKDGNPIESQRVGSKSRSGPAPVPDTIELAASEGHLFIPMYQTAKAMTPGEVREKHIKCSHNGEPALEAVFRLSAR